MFKIKNLKLSIFLVVCVTSCFTLQPIKSFKYKSWNNVNALAVNKNETLIAADCNHGQDLMLIDKNGKVERIINITKSSFLRDDIIVSGISKKISNIQFCNNKYIALVVRSTDFSYVSRKYISSYKEDTVSDELIILTINGKIISRTSVFYEFSKYCNKGKRVNFDKFIKDNKRMQEAEVESLQDLFEVYKVSRVSANGKYIAIAIKGKNHIRLFTVPKLKLIKEINLRGTKITDMSFNPQNNNITIINSEGIIIEYNLRGKKIRTLKHKTTSRNKHQKWNGKISYSDNGKYLVSYMTYINPKKNFDPRKDINFWKSDGTFVKGFGFNKKHTSSILSSIFNDNRIVLINNDRFIVYNFDGKVIKDAEISIYADSLVLSRSNKLYAASSYKGIKIYDLDKFLKGNN